MSLHAHIGNEEKRFHQKQGYVGHCYMKCGKCSLYSTHPCVPTNPQKDGTWGVQNQHFPNIIYAVKFRFTKISCCTCECELRRNMCKHKIVVISHTQTLFMNISFIIVEHGIDHIVEHWVTCLWTHDIFQMIWNPTMMKSWNSMGSWPWNKVISLWVAL